jgi:hypothetical protein
VLTLPWCESCSKYYAPTALTEEGTCPTCGRPVGEPEVPAEPTPWHFKLLVLATVVYLGWRFVQLVGIA